MVSRESENLGKPDRLEQARANRCAEDGLVVDQVENGFFDAHKLLTDRGL